VNSERPPLFAIAATSGPPVAILGVPFDNVTTRQTIAIIEEMIASRRPHYLATANVDFTVQALHDPELQRILLDAHLVVCDGMPLVWASRWLGNPLPERVAGSDLAPLLLRVAAEKGYRVFFLGAEQAVAETAIAKIRETHPGIQIAGQYSPPFSPLLEMDHDGICARIREANADLLFVSFGCPKQEKWIAMNYRKLGTPVSIGVGATIDFIAGHMKRAPRWMQATGLEWIYRLLQEPKRLMRRYFVDLWVFGRAILVQLWQLRTRDSGDISSEGAQSIATSRSASDAIHLVLSGIIDAATARSHQDEWLSLASAATNGLLVDCSGVQTFDSSGAGLLIRLQKNCRAAGHPMVLLAPSHNVLKALTLMRLTPVFDIAANDGDGRAILAKRFSETHTPVIGGTSPGETSWHGEVTAANVDTLWESVSDQVAKLGAGTKLRIDISAVRFVDSTGVGMMIRLKKLAHIQGADVVFCRPVGPVLAVIRLLKLEAYLLES